MTEAKDRVRATSSDKVNQRLDRRRAARLERDEAQNPAALTRRLSELDREWDMERLLETNASILALAGLALGVAHDRKWLLLPGVVATFLLQHALQGWCPPVPVFRRLGVRTRKEIDQEKYAVKALRGDFADLDAAPSAEAALRAVRAS